MSKGAVSFNESNVEYYTPKYIVDRFGPFDYDPATTPAQAEYLGIPNYDTKETDGLFSDWTQYRRIWINPPFNIKHLFIEKAAATYAKSKNDIFMLLPVQTLTAGYFHATMDGLLGGVKIFIPCRRIKFITPTGVMQSPAFGSVIIHFQDKNELELINI